MQNICRFIPPSRTAQNMQTVNFVYEASPERVISQPCAPVYRVHYVTAGEGSVRCGNYEQTVREGDVFFSFPALSYVVLPQKGFQYMYISYTGIRAGAEMERLDVTPRNFVFRSCQKLLPLWQDGINGNAALSDLISESVLLYTLAFVGESLLQEKKQLSIPSLANCALIKSYIDENYADPDLSCEKIATHFSYNKKYISTLFKKHYQMPLTAYIQSVRIHEATMLIAQGEERVGVLAAGVGFRDALYFSKVFKRETGLSPRAYICKSQNQT